MSGLIQNVSSSGIEKIWWNFKEDRMMLEYILILKNLSLQILHTQP